MPTDKELEKKRDKIARLREQLADEQAKVAVNAAEQSNVIEAAQLDTEVAKLEAQLAAAKEQTKRSVAKEGTSSTLAAVTEELEAAQRPITPPGVAVDTNPSDADSDKKKDGE